MMIRVFDIIFSLLGLILFSPIIVLLIIIGFFDTGSPFFEQIRVGLNQKPFRLIKFRSMKIGTQTISTHLVSSSAITKWGAFLRKSKLDELPQLYNVLIGDMSFVGPRPNLFNQSELMSERTALGVYKIRPGITGLAQIKEIDMSTPKKLAKIDALMIKNLNLITYIKLILLTFAGKGFGDRIRK